MKGGVVYKNAARSEPLILDMETRKNLKRRFRLPALAPFRRVD